MKRALPFAIFMCLVFSLALTASGCGYFTFIKGAGQLPSTKDDPETVQPAQERIRPYQIMGVSDRLTKNEWLGLIRWREDAAQIARQNPGEVFLNGPRSSKAVCLTFDDGPDGVFTPEVLDILKRYGIHGSFFFIGQYVKNYPAVTLRADQEGNLVLSHTWDHKNLSRLSDQAIGRELDMTANEIAGITGKHPAILRPPYGAVNDRVIADLRGSNYKIVMWSIDSLDWSQKQKENIVRNVLSNVRPGDVILMHSGGGDRQATVQALPAIITGLQAQGYSFLTLDQMLDIPAYQ